MKAKIRQHDDGVYLPATSLATNLPASINGTKTENILFVYKQPDELENEDYNMLIWHDGYVFAVQSIDFDFVDEPKPKFKAGTYEDFVTAVHLSDMTGGTEESYRLAEKLKLTYSHWCDFCGWEVPTYSEMGWKPDGCFICGGSVIPNKDLFFYQESQEETGDLKKIKKD